MDILTVGQMAEINGVSKQTLRLYDKLGILKPRHVGQGNGYRYYDISQCARLDMINYMKSLGMELRVIKEQLDRKDIGLLKSILEQKKDDVDNRMREMRFQKRAIERMLRAYDLYENAPPDGTIILEYIPERLIYISDSGVNFFEHGIEVYEKILRNLKQDLLSHHLPHIYFGNAGTILRRDKLQKRKFSASEFFVLVDEDIVPRELTTPLPSGMFMCIYSNRFENEIEYSLRLLDAIRKQGYNIAGDCYCEVIIDSPVLEESRKDMFFRIQVPVSFR